MQSSPTSSIPASVIPASVLIVDDLKENRLALRAVLDGGGFDVREARSGPEALRMVLAEEFAVILLDLQMPEMDGLETARLIRSRQRSQAVPIVFITAHGLTEDWAMRGYEAGAVDYLTKPFNPQLLKAKVDVFVDLFRKRKELQEERRLHSMLSQRTIQLERSNADLEQFAYAASHDLQEPLRAIAGFLGLLDSRYGTSLDEEGRHYIARTVQAAERMRALINDLLTFSRIQRSPALFDEVDCASLLRGVLVELEGSIEETGAKVTVGRLPVIRGNRQLIGQLFRNLISNSLKFRGEDPPRIKVACKVRSTEYHFTVEDNGIGIDPRFRERVFQLFQRLHSREQYPGTGIGLTVCRTIVERHGGKIWVESNATKGCTFHFRIPALEGTDLDDSQGS